MPGGLPGTLPGQATSDKPGPQPSSCPVNDLTGSAAGRPALPLLSQGADNSKNRSCSNPQFTIAVLLTAHSSKSNRDPADQHG